ncbi:MAG: hypothetical protein M1834_002434 [Cirrosporium novae-zelandiae]|nr:MAG: hypothetical protein M1834_002434 [Cirrosporium novae-zelandiae]
MPVDNDTRGWIMAAVSGVACVVGSSIICVDIIVRRFPGMRNFKIEDSNVFLASSLSLSFGVMLFSSLYGMLPEAKEYLENGGYGPSNSAFILITLFLAGAIFIQVFSGFLHRYMPSHVVDCDHTHEDHEDGQEVEVVDHDETLNGSTYGKQTVEQTGDIDVSEDTPLLSREISRENIHDHPHGHYHSTNDHLSERLRSRTTSPPSLAHRMTMMFQRKECDSTGPCYGYSEPCGEECFKVIPRSNSKFDHWLNALPSRRASLANSLFVRKTSSQLPEVREEANKNTGTIQRGRSAPFFHHEYPSRQSTTFMSPRETSLLPRTQSEPVTDRVNGDLERQESSFTSLPAVANQHEHHPHHHHVPTNAFLSIGLQTSIAIALHKLPEGFITYATNHANPDLGFAVFMALFIHNITEGFAMALPLYLALQSRTKAILWSSLLGGVSQPLGAGVAALWFKIAGDGNMKPGETVYGCMFAITAGIMASVALQLFVESQGLTHNKTLCVMFAFLGMGILGLSFALTAE